MWGWWQVVPRIAQRYPWPTNVLLYGALYTSGDALQQLLQGCEPDWQQTRCVATVAIGFHANFNYVWLRLLERALPGRTPRAVLSKVLCDQLLGGPIALSAFYTGEGLPRYEYTSGKEDKFLDLKQKFWNTYKTGLLYWPFVQITNFGFVPIYLRTAYTGLCGFLWASFLCYSQQRGDGTVSSVFSWLKNKEASEVKRSPEK